MQRQQGSLRHDYKPTPSQKNNGAATKKNAWPWFAAGVLLPILLIVALLRPTSDSTNPDTDSSNEPVAPQTLLTQNETTAVLDDAISQAANNEADVTNDSVIIEHTLPATATPTAEPDLLTANTRPAVQPAIHAPLALPPEVLNITIKRGDTLDGIFRRNSLNLGDLAEIASLDEAAEHVKRLIPGDELVIEHDGSKVLSLYRDLDLTNAVRIERQDSSFVTHNIERPIEVRHHSAYGRIDSSLFESAATAGLSHKTVMNLAGIFAWDIDFILDIRQGDDYHVVYEQLYQEGELVGDGEIVAAEFNNNGRVVQALRYIDKTGRSDYFAPDGRSMRKAFIRAPVDFTRISSNFNPFRRHPILNTIRAHRGVDYAAPKGTPIKAAGDGKVIFRGVQSGYGNTVILQHGGNITTLYAHLSAFDKNAHINQRVTQGQTIGYVGMTGLATAPHLHYEYRINGVHRNPVTVTLPEAEPIRADLKADFLAKAAPLLEELEQFKRTQLALLSAE